MSEVTYTVTIEALSAGGRGRARLDGQQVFIPWTAPGDRVRITIRRQHRQYAEGEVVELLAPGPARVTPPCPVFGVCGGCQWQHLAYEAQVAWKRLILTEQLERLAGLDSPQVLPTVAADSPWHYRRRIRLHLDAQGRVGFYRAGTHEVVEFAACAIATAALNQQLPAVKEKIRREGNGRLVCEDNEAGFIQVNAEQNRRLQQLVQDGVQHYGGGTVVELYAGSGNLTFPLAAYLRSIVAVDEDAHSIARAQHRVREQRLAHVTFVCTAAAPFMRRLQQTHDRVDGVLLDPPRRGAAEVMTPLLAVRPRWIGYVSCDPATLARDVKTLVAEGYRHCSSQPIDMFPQTFHIESLTWLQAVN